METTDHNLSSQEARTLAERDFNFLGMLCMPEDFLFGFPDFFILLFMKMTSFEKAVQRFALGFPRGFAKTTWVKVLCVWYILFSRKNFILIVCAREELAVNVVSDIVGMLTHPNIVKLFGNWETNVEEDQQHKKVFYFRGRTIILQGIGAGTSVRGINRNNKRPDVIIMDDIQKKEDAPNKELADKLMTWMTGTLMMACSNRDVIFIFIGNMYPQNSLLDQLRKSKYWESFVVGGLLADGSSLWEELRPRERLLEEWEALRDLGQEDTFLAEVLNSTDMPLMSGADLNKVPMIPDWILSTPSDGGFVLIDPSGERKTSDDCAIEGFLVTDGIPWLYDIEFGTFTPKETILNSLKLAIRINVRLICVEAVAYQASLLFWFQDHCNTHGIEGFEFHPVAPRNQAKNKRIKLGMTKCLKGEIYLHNRIRSLIIDQWKSWNPTKTTNKDDLIDPLGYVEQVMTEYPQFIPHPLLLGVDGVVTAAHNDDIEFDIQV